jgi:cytoskeletal protein RodZ
MQGPHKDNQPGNNFSLYFLVTIFYAIWNYVTSIYNTDQQHLFLTPLPESDGAQAPTNGGQDISENEGDADSEHSESSSERSETGSNHDDQEIVANLPSAENAKVDDNTETGGIPTPPAINAAGAPFVYEEYVEFSANSANLPQHIEENNRVNTPVPQPPSYSDTDTDEEHAAYEKKVPFAGDTEENIQE